MAGPDRQLKFGVPALINPLINKVTGVPGGSGRTEQENVRPSESDGFLLDLVII